MAGSFLLAVSLVLCAGARAASRDDPAPHAAPAGSPPALLDDGRLLVMRGSLPIVLSAPHGGSASPEGWPRRSGGVQVQDRNTLPMVEALAEALRRRTGRMPSVVAGLVHRRHLDLNRDERRSGATAGEAQRELWSRYHDALEERSAAALASGGGRALLVDLHGHGHPHGLIELGHAISAEVLRGPDEGLSDAAWVRGPRSLGARLDAFGFASVPSPTRPAPEDGQAYYDGGYIVRRHRGEGLRAIQIELPPDPRRRDAAGRQALVEALAEALIQVLADHRMLAAQPLEVRPTAELGVWGPGEEPWSRPRWRSVAGLAGALPEAVVVHGVPVLAPPGTGRGLLLEGASRLLEGLDADGDGRVDDPQALLGWQRAGRTYGVGEAEALDRLELPSGTPWRAPLPVPLVLTR